MYLVKRQEYNANIDICEGDLVKLAYDDQQEHSIGIVLQVILDIKNDDHLSFSEEVLIALVLMCGDVSYYEEDELIIIEKICNN
jgi:hypothetical protein|tara:strand:- start:7318 stop:7569 length:252 start_codon:yes stop_codon:yes gene_type:complete